MWFETTFEDGLIIDPNASVPSTMNDVGKHVELLIREHKSGVRSLVESVYLSQARDSL